MAALLSPTGSGSALPSPQLVIMGGGYSHDDFLSLYDAFEGTKTVPWIRPLGTKPGGPGLPPAPPPATEVAARVRRVVDEHSQEIRSGAAAGQVWWM